MSVCSVDRPDRVAAVVGGYFICKDNVNSGYERFVAILTN